MKAKHFFKFVGEDSLGYVNGSTYALSIFQRSLSQRVTGVFMGAPFSWKIIIVKPLFCPYESLEAFRANWKFEYTSIEGDSDE